MSHSILDRTPNADSPLATAPETVLVVGATGGIGQAFCEALVSRFPKAQLIRMARSIEKLKPLSSDTQDLEIDLLKEASINAAVDALPNQAQIDWVFIATGWLHDDHFQPEKSYRSLSGDHLTKAFQLNTFGPALLVKNLLQRFNRKHPVTIGLLTARVGSISDNRLGGWYSYRASKAALNMFIKNYAIECDRSRRSISIVGLQPGTTDTKLSAPFQRGVAPENLQTTEYTATQLVSVMAALELEDSGLLFDFLGLPFDP